VYRSNSSAERIAVFSEVYYADGCHAYIDGNPAPHFRANYILRAMKVPAGQHEIRFVFKPTMLQWSNLINLIGFLMILLALLFSGFKIYKERKQSSGNPS
jgi:uncharacterized membrane protein YfhO